MQQLAFFSNFFRSSFGVSLTGSVTFVTVWLERFSILGSATFTWATGCSAFF
jgi:hypothetical protein